MRAENYVVQKPIQKQEKRQFSLDSFREFKEKAAMKLTIIHFFEQAPNVI